MRREGECGASTGIARERCGQHEEVVHIEPRAAPIRLARRDHQVGRRADAADRRPRKQTERRRAPRRATTTSRCCGQLGASGTLPGGRSRPRSTATAGGIAGQLQLCGAQGGGGRDVPLQPFTSGRCRDGVDVRLDFVEHAPRLEAIVRDRRNHVCGEETRRVHTVNGGVTVRFTANPGAATSFKTRQRQRRRVFPGRSVGGLADEINRNRSIVGTINGGGHEFELRTFNSNVYVRKGR
jgi:hypothetical protein